MFQKIIIFLGILWGFGTCSSSEVQTPSSNQTEESLPAGYRVEILASPKLVNGTTFSKGSKLIFDKDEFLRTATLGEDQIIMDAKYKKQMPHTFRAGSILQFKEPKNSFGDLNKNLDIPKTITTLKPTEIFGYTFEAGTSFIFPSENKKPFMGIAIERTRSDLVINGKKIQAGSTLLFEDKENIKVLVKGEWKQP